QLDRPRTVVLGQRVRVELGERACQSLLYLRRERSLAVLPVDGDELRELVGTLDHALQNLSHPGAVRGMTRHLAHEREGRMTQLHLLARLNGKRSHAAGIYFGHEFTDASSNLDAILIELVFPKHAGQHRTAELLLGA